MRKAVLNLESRFYNNNAVKSLCSIPLKTGTLNEKAARPWLGEGVRWPIFALAYTLTKNIWEVRNQILVVNTAMPVLREFDPIAGRKCNSWWRIEATAPSFATFSGKYLKQSNFFGEIVQCHFS